MEHGADLYISSPTDLPVHFPNCCRLFHVARFVAAPVRILMGARTEQVSLLQFGSPRCLKLIGNNGRSVHSGLAHMSA